MCLSCVAFKCMGGVGNRQIRGVREHSRQSFVYNQKATPVSQRIRGTVVGFNENFFKIKSCVIYP
jgi:hypothetical protein